MNKVIASAFFLVFTSAFSPVIAYPQVEMQACMANALNAVVTKGLKVNYTQVKNYCDCSMRKIAVTFRKGVTPWLPFRRPG
jgi:hypothetical protein